MLKANITTGRAQRGDKKNGSFVSLSFLLPKLSPLKCPKWLIFVFPVDGSKK